MGELTRQQISISARAIALGADFDLESLIKFHPLLLCHSAARQLPNF
jgi:hypothetical protein